MRQLKKWMNSRGHKIVFDQCVPNGTIHALKTVQNLGMKRCTLHTLKECQIGDVAEVAEWRQWARNHEYPLASEHTSNYCGTM